MNPFRPRFSILDDELATRIEEEARTVLAEVGIEFLGAAAREVLLAAGLTEDGGRFRIPSSVVDRCLETAPETVTMYDRDGNVAADLAGRDVHFTPGSSAMHYLDPDTGEARRPTTEDFVRFTVVTDALPHLYATSTAFVPGDVPEEVSDAWRLYLALRHSTKPVVTGAFGSATLALMLDLLDAVRGGPEELAARPLAIFSVCPSSPLRFTEATSDNLVECGRRGVPVELIGMPMSGLVAPVTLVGTLIQHTAENLSGLVLSQLAAPGAPILWGGSPAVFDIRSGTTPLGAIESMMVAAGYVEMGRRMGLPTQAYMGTSDAKVLDAQAGMESGMGAMMAALAGADSISGAGMLELENCQSAEKLVIDHEACGALRFLRSGVAPAEDFPARPIMERLLTEKTLLIDEHSRRHRPSQRCDPSAVICRADRSRWKRRGATSVVDRARAEVARILETHRPAPLEPARDEALRGIMRSAAEPHGLTDFPGEL